GEALLRLIRDGAPLGLRAIVTGGRLVGSGRLSSLLDRRLVLPMPDPWTSPCSKSSQPHLDACVSPGAPST
ncbi:MAG TPA: hypothetical protein VFN43_03340, partial [Humibacillus sp.]|nr:hypothetical protein [Humibacillus sp.]